MRCEDPVRLKCFDSYVAVQSLAASSPHTQRSLEQAIVERFRERHHQRIPSAGQRRIKVPCGGFDWTLIGRTNPKLTPEGRCERLSLGVAPALIDDERVHSAVDQRSAHL